MRQKGGISLKGDNKIFNQEPKKSVHLSLDL